MNKLQVRSEIWYKLKHGQPIDLVVTMESTGSASAKMYIDKIVVECSNAKEGKHINISTPFAFEIIDAMTIHEDGITTDVQICNGADAITEALTIAANDEDIDKFTEIDESKSTFQRGDDDLQLEITSNPFYGKVIIEIEPIVS